LISALNATSENPLLGRSLMALHHKEFLRNIGGDLPRICHAFCAVFRTRSRFSARDCISRQTEKRNDFQGL
jgi:hypothetical protein